MNRIHDNFRILSKYINYIKVCVLWGCDSRRVPKNILPSSEGTLKPYAVSQFAVSTMTVNQIIYSVLCKIWSQTQIKISLIICVPAVAACGALLHLLLFTKLMSPRPAPRCRYV